MAQTCEACGREIGFFSCGNLCGQCQKLFKAELARLEKEILTNKDLAGESAEIIKKGDKKTRRKLYNRLFRQFESRGELGQTEITALQKLQQALDLSDDEVNSLERIKPYEFLVKAKEAIAKGASLPAFDLSTQLKQKDLTGIAPIIRKNEVVHYASPASLIETEEVVSEGLLWGIKTRIRDVEATRGVLILTSQRLFLCPFPWEKPVEIPLYSIFHVESTRDNLVIFSRGRRRPYYFRINNRVAIKVFEACLRYLLTR